MVGHLFIEPGTKSGLRLTDDSKQFVVLEAKMFSPLSKKVSNAPNYDQATRTVACMAKTIEFSGREVDELDSVGFYVVAPKEQIEGHLFSNIA